MLRNLCWVFSGEHGLSKERCDFLVKRGLEAQEQVATHQNENQTYSSDDKVRASRISWLHGEDIYECVRPFVNKANEEAGWRFDVRQIENIIIKFLSIYKVKSNSDEKNVGIWIKDKKVAAIGIRVSRWIAYHGFSINIKNNLNDYKKILPCGLKNEKITSLKNEKKDISNVKKNLKTIIQENLYKI